MLSAYYYSLSSSLCQADSEIFSENFLHGERTIDKRRNFYYNRGDMRICIYGAGAMGTSLGNFLAKGNVACDLVTRNARHVAALKASGARAFLPQEMEGEYDVVFLATKQRENPAIARFLAPFLGENGALVTVQNGLPEEGLAEVFGRDRVYGATLGWGAQLESPGVVKLTSEGKPSVALGAYGKGEKLEKIAALFDPAVFDVRVGDLAEIRFAKLVFNASLSTLSAISGLSYGELSKKHAKLAILLIREVLCVAEVYGCKHLYQNGHEVKNLFKGPFARLILPVAMKKHANIRSGMLRDLEAGRRCDVDYVAGAVVKAGRARGMETPLLARAVALVHDIENGLAEIAPESLGLIGA